jgi:hypothetical protein
LSILIGFILKYKSNAIMIFVAFMLLSGTFAYGYHKGSISEIIKITKKTKERQEKLFDLTDIVRMQTDELRRLNREKEDLVNELERKALSAKGSNNSGVGTTGGLLRLEHRWGKTTTATQ